MLAAIILKELNELIRDGRIRIVAVIAILLLIIASITGVNQYQKNKDQYTVASATERTVWETQEEKNPHSAAHYGTYIFKPTFALSVFDYGVSAYTGNSIFIEAHNQNEASYSEAADQTSLARFGTLSINFVLLYLFPLMIILIGYNSYTKEKRTSNLFIIKKPRGCSSSISTWKMVSHLDSYFSVTTLVFLTVGIVVLTQSRRPRVF